MASGIPLAFKESILDRSIHAGVDLDTDTLRILLVTADHSGNLATWQDRADVTDEVANGNGYTTGGATLASVTVTASGSTATFDSADPTWPSSTFTTRGAWIYKSSGTASTDLLILWIDFGGNQAVTSGTFTIQVSASGWMTLS